MREDSDQNSITRLAALCLSLTSGGGTHCFERPGTIRDGQRIELLRLIHNDPGIGTDGAGIAIGLSRGLSEGGIPAERQPG